MKKVSVKIEPDSSQPVRAEPPELPPHATTAETFAAFMASGLHHLAVNADIFLHQPSPQEIHQMRVAARRLRALLGVFRSVLPSSLAKRIARDLKQLQQTLGPARDLDVFLDDLLPTLPSLPMQTMLARAARKPHRQAYARATKILHGPILARVQAGFSELVAAVGKAREGRKSGRDFGRKLLGKRHRKLVQRLEGAKTRSDKRLHALRIRIKKLRYAVEFFRPLLPKGGAKRFYGALAEAQDVLGAFNDAANALALSRALMRKSPGFDPIARRAIDAAFAAAEDQARPRARRKFSALKPLLKKSPRHWFV